MEGLRRNRKFAVGGLVVLGALIGLVTFVVVPALASTAGGSVPPPSATQQVLPTDVNTGGQSNDCQVFYASNPGSQPPYQYRISNPQSGTYTTTAAGATVTFTLKMNPGNAGPTVSPAYANDKYVNFTATGAKVVDVGIKGGTDTTRYAYGSKPLGYVTGGTPTDSYLHAPAQSVDANNQPTQLYSVSNLTFCFDVGGSVSGTVFQDANQNGTNDTGDTAQSGWTVRLYGSTSSTPVTSTTSGTNGSYRLKAVLDPAKTYRVCEAPPSGTWAQSKPLPSSANLCSGTGELKKGYSFIPASATDDIGGKDFGNAPSVVASCPPPTPFGLSNYQVQLAVCKPGQTYVFGSNPGIIDGNTATPPPSVSIWVADETQGPVPLVERITFPFLVQTPQPLLTLYYDDTFPFSQADAVPMPFCKLDPRIAGSEFDLQSGFLTVATAANVLPAGATSCLIVASQTAPPDPVNQPTLGSYTAYVYSSIDGLRFGGP